MWYNDTIGSHGDPTQKGGVCLQIQGLAGRLLAAALAASMLVMPASAAQYDDFDAVWDSSLAQRLENEPVLAVSGGSEDRETADETLYLTGSSDPDYPLVFNGEEVEDRGEYGSFGVYLELELGDNQVTLDNGDQSVSFVITRKEPSTGSSTQVPIVSSLGRCQPASDDIAYDGDRYTLRCTAPANAESVTATLDGETYELTQESAAQTGVEAYYSAEITIQAPEEGEVLSLGTVQYNLVWEGVASSKESAGQLYAVGEGASPVVRVSQSAATLYDSGETQNGSAAGNEIGTLALNAHAVVTDANDTMFQLAMGGWVNKTYAALEEGHDQPGGALTGAQWETTEDGGFALRLKGANFAPFKSYLTSEKLVLRGYGLTGFPDCPMPDNATFGGMDVQQDGDELTLSFALRSPQALQGYQIFYEDNGDALLYFNPKVTIYSSEQPLKGMIIVVDPGHGGRDIGAPGVLGEIGPNEKEITFVTSMVVKNRLESLGATVLTTVDDSIDDLSKAELNDRNIFASYNKADLFLSFHCNSIATTSNGGDASGTEIYYHEASSKRLADLVQQNITSYTGRKDRGVKYGMYYVTRNTSCPSMLIELGFLTNPQEFDAMRSPEQIYQTANAVGDAVVAWVRDLD